MLVHNKGNYIRHFGSIVLVPGANEVDNALKSEFEKQASVKLNKHLIDTGEIVIPDKKGSAGGVDSIVNLAANDAIKLAMDTFDKELLERFLADEKEAKSRVSVVKAIEEQLESQFNPDEDSIVNPNE